MLVSDRSHMLELAEASTFLARAVALLAALPDDLPAHEAVHDLICELMERCQADEIHDLVVTITGGR